MRLNRENLRTREGYRLGKILFLLPMGDKVTVKVKIFLGLDDNFSNAEFGIPEFKTFQTTLKAKKIYENAKVGDHCFVVLDKNETKINELVAERK